MFFINESIDYGALLPSSILGILKLEALPESAAARRKPGKPKMQSAFSFLSKTKKSPGKVNELAKFLKKSNCKEVCRLFRYQMLQH